MLEVASKDGASVGASVSLSEHNFSKAAGAADDKWNQPFSFKPSSASSQA